MADTPHAAFRRRLEERYDFAGWAARASAAPPRRFAADSHALPGVRLAERGALTGGGHIDQLVGADPADERIVVTVLPHADAASAHEALLGLLGDAMAERLPRCEEHGLSIGDVCFCGGGEPVDRIWFARGNVLVRVESIGERAIAVADVAAALDAQIAAAASG
jgi:hypothetical protein